MEDLIAAYPSEFFTRHSLTLQGRQGSFPGAGRFDLLFADEFNTNIIMELKAVTAKYEDATQLARYRDALLANGLSKVLMWLVAPSIPRSVRDFWDHIGIEYTEIHESEFQVVAERHGHSLAEELLHVAEPQAQPTSLTIRTQRRVKPLAATSDWFLNTDEGETPGVGAYRRMIEQSCVALWGSPGGASPQEKLSMPQRGERVFFYLNRVGIVATGLFTAEMPKESDNIFGKRSEQEFSRAVSDLISVANECALNISEVSQMGYKLPAFSAFCRISNTEVAGKMLQELQARSSGRTETDATAAVLPPHK